MVSFSCEACNETIAKKKAATHKSRCRNAVFTCLDCSTTFEGNNYSSHTQCISEAEKYEKGLYRPTKKQKKNNTQVELNTKNDKDSITDTTSIDTTGTKETKDTKATKALKEPKESNTNIKNTDKKSKKKSKKNFDGVIKDILQKNNNSISLKSFNKIIKNDHKDIYKSLMKSIQLQLGKDSTIKLELA